MTWVAENASFIAQLTGIHLVQSILPLLFGLVIAIPIAQLARQSRPVSTVILSASSILYTIPSLALFIILPVVLGTGVLDLTNVIVALTIYAVALLVRSCVDAFGSVDDTVRQAAVAVGYTPVRRFFTVDLPLSVPVLIAGLRVVSVSNISLVSVGAVIGIPSLGVLFTDGLQRNFMTPLIVGIVITLLLALVMDALLVLIERLLTPWTRARKAVRA
ncbi:glycine/betaine ABC transporter permease [Tersicoccus solisilvae]|uniref:Glycine/betaine ABC transporter permease n=1 Tax=Tersicoccus solisilvae TaxID=1882339 RepID=A0ABQ1P6J4_9MICC|nr:ABC transporter permease [Tersicoccus solisilvae]GGC91090.1 glycine/betaine ABC transporter permease [Tersicoccus solisilvae]